jgi:hypothetical protein
VSDYALLRAADLALAEGYDWFRVSERYVRPAEDGSSSSVSIGVGGASFGRRSGVGLGLGTSFPLSGGPVLMATLEVVMGHGDKPADPGAFDARGVRRAVGARI